MNRIKELRAEFAMKQSELASRLQCSGAAISRYELGQRELDYDTLCKLCEIFNCTADYLLCRSDIRSYNLSPQEIALLMAYRAADVRAREMVDLALRPFAPDLKKTETA